MTAVAPTIDPSRLEAMTLPQRVALLGLLEERARRYAQRLYYEIYPDQNTVWRGPPVQKGLIATGQTLHARHLYEKHMEFFAVGAQYSERCAMMANRVGKTFGLGAFETAAHLTGDYRPWWPGRRFGAPVSWWAAGKTYETTRDIMQLALLGEVVTRNGRKTVDGRGIIPGHLLGQPTWKSGVADLVDVIPVKHVGGGWSDLGFKAYNQGRGSFEGTGKHGVWFDEEPPLPVYGEALIRTATLNGMIFITFTPLAGLSQVVLQFLPADQRPDFLEVEELLAA